MNDAELNLTNALFPWESEMFTEKMLNSRTENVLSTRIF